MAQAQIMSATRREEHMSDAIQVTGDAVDPLFAEPYVEIDEQRAAPVPHRYVHGGFKGTGARFSFYFPPKEQYRGRFHHNTYPLADTSDVGPFPIAFDVSTGDIGFSFDSGAYYVQTNNGAAFSRTQGDPTVAAYRANAAAAKYSRVLAQQIYGGGRPFGYLYGGSGGAYQTIGGAEHTQGVWDGFMPFVLGSNNATPGNFTVRMHALRVLRQRNRFPGVMDAVNPGGSGDIYAGLDEEEREALRDVTRMGWPPKGWYAYETQGSGYFADIQGAVPGLDPTYLEDFWSKPGYLGADPNSSIHAHRLQFETTVSGVSAGPPREVELSALPDRPIADFHLVLTSGPMAGRSVAIAEQNGRKVRFSTNSDPAVVAAFAKGDAVRLDNSWTLALQSYHRHQLPLSRAEYGWDHLRDASGQPLYPQREKLMGHTFALAAVGSLLTGDLQGKTLLVQALMDIDAYPWFADWYRSMVKQAMGPAADESFALWFIEHAQHDNPHTDVARAHAIRLSGALQQGLRDLARWVEEGVRPTETRYSVAESQVSTPATAAERRGIQAVASLSANGGVTAQVAVGEPVRLTGEAEVPEGYGVVVSADWDFAGSGRFEPQVLEAPQARVSVSATHAYDKPGTYFPGLRVTSQREGDAATPYARVENLARARVVVR
jgi:hypothetical protein